MSREEKQARKRAEIILKVRTGQMTAKEGAEALGVSRKTYYEWEKRGLEGMLEALSDRPSGRPAQEKDEEKENLRKEKRDLEMRLRLSEEAGEIRALLESLPPLEEKKRGRKKDGGRS